MKNNLGGILEELVVKCRGIIAVSSSDTPADIIGRMTKREIDTALIAILSEMKKMVPDKEVINAYNFSPNPDIINDAEIRRGGRNPNNITRKDGGG